MSRTPPRPSLRSPDRRPARTTTSRSVERRGRGPRGPIFPPTLPRYSSRGSKFDEATLEAFARIDVVFHEQLEGIDLAVDMVPRMRLRPGASWPESVVADGEVPLARVLPPSYDDKGNPVRPRIIVFRKPIEHRCRTEKELQQLLYTILVTLVAYYLNVEPSIIDPQWGER